MVQWASPFWTHWTSPQWVDTFHACLFMEAYTGRFLSHNYVVCKKSCNAIFLVYVKFVTLKMFQNLLMTSILLQLNSNWIPLFSLLAVPRSYIYIYRIILKTSIAISMSFSSSQKLRIFISLQYIYFFKYVHVRLSQIINIISI